jgi:flagellar hook-associated protein 2
MASPFAVSGLASTIDTKSMIEQLISIERAPARLVESKKAAAQSKLGAIQAMNTKLLAVKTAVDDLKLSTAFTSRQATSSSDKIAAVSVSGSPATGAVTVNVKTLASAHQLATAAQGTANDPIASSGSITVRAAGATTDTVVEVSDYSLNGIAEAINRSNAGVSAGVINDGTGYRLLVTSNASGTSNGIVSLDADGDLAAVLPGTLGMTEVVPARNALITIGDPDFGMPIESASNTMDQAMPGLTLRLASTGDGVNITVSNDGAGAKAKAQALVDTLNSAREYLTTNGRYDAATKKAGVLFSEYDIARQLDSLANDLSKTFPGEASGYRSLSEIGITVDASGAYSLKAETFDAKLAQDSKAVSSLFLAAGSAVSSTLDGLTRSVNGTMAVKESSLTSSIESFSERIAAIDARLERRKSFYQAKFLAMERITAQLQSQGNAMSSFITGLSKSSK